MVLVSERTPLALLTCHPGLESGSIGPTLERLKDGPRLKAGVTVE
jgi:hypothetical protein